jgi:tripeptidyl-peptidase I
MAASLSAGGFSNVSEMPDYQYGAVNAYLSSLGETNAGLFNASGRGFPDVAAYGQNVQVFNGGQLVPVGGTSCSTPIFASTIALLNDQLANVGKPPLGFLNPWLYQNPGTLNDIEGGSNPGCSTNGFPAGPGWDPVTGLGSPNFASMLVSTGVTPLA